MQVLTHRVSRHVLVGVILGSALLGGVAHAAGAIPGANGVINGCYERHEGRLRVIDPATQRCERDETPLPWNQTGPQGPQGLQGPQGPQGAKGDPGASGLANLTVRSATTDQLHDGRPLTVACQPGEIATGGGGRTSSDLLQQRQFEAGLSTGGSSAYLSDSEPVVDPNGTPTGWQVRATNLNLGQPTPLVVYAVCAR